MQLTYNKNLINTETNTWYYAKIDQFGQLLTSSVSTSNGTRDSFGRLRVAQISTQMDIKQIHDDQPLFFDTELIGTGSNTYVNETASTLLETSADLDVAIRQTFQKSNYQSGKGHQILVTFANMETETNIEKRVGYFSSNTTTPFDSDLDGLFLESSNGTHYFKTYRNGTVTNTVERSNWNDPMDGTGISGINLDFTKTQICEFTFEWLGVGTTTMRFVVDGAYIQAHVFKNANNTTDVYMSTPNHPIRYSIRQTGVGSGSFKQICCTVGSEGAINELGTIQSTNLGTGFINANSTSNNYALIGIRLQEDKTDSAIDVLDVNAIALTNDNFLWSVIFNPTVAGTFTYSDVPNSSVMVANGDTSGNPSTTTVTGGTVLASGYVSSAGGGNGGALSQQIVNAIRLGVSIGGTLDEIVLCAQPLSANLDITGSFDWRNRT